MEVVLASTSPYRRALIQRLGLAVTVAAPDYDEPLAREALGPQPLFDVAVALAEGKARSVAGRFPHAVIIGSDQVGEIDGELLGKPGTVDRACQQLRRLSGRTHQLYTAVAVHVPATEHMSVALDVHRLTMRRLTDDAIAAYVARDNPVDCAGGYKVEALGIALFERVMGDDFTAVIGLPLTRLVELLAAVGVDVLTGRGVAP